MRRGRCLPAWVLCLAALVSPAGAGTTGAEAPSEYQMKAAFLYHFAKFVEWPPRAFSDATEPLCVGILGEDPFGDALEQIFKNNTVAGRRVLIQRSDTLERLRNCQIVFISLSQKRHLPQIFRSLEHARVLTIGEASDFSRQGGMIGFTMHDSRVRFEINVDATARAGLRISSKLLNLATIVRDNRAAEVP